MSKEHDIINSSIFGSFMNNDYRIIEILLEKINLFGRNLEGAGQRSFKPLTSHFENNNPQILEHLKFLEEYYFRLFEEARLNQKIVKPMQVSDDKVVIKPGTPFHLCVPKLEVLKNISNGGVLASEWFGILESEQEGIFCTFLNTTIDQNDEETIGFVKDMNVRKSLGVWGDVALYFDNDNPIMQELMSIDFFKYAYLRNESKLEELKNYPPEIISLYERIIYPSSVAGRYMHNSTSESKFWRAIPGGIPPQLINGICLNSKKHQDLIERSLEISELFPNATIFDEDKNVLRYPKAMDEPNKTK